MQRRLAILFAAALVALVSSVLGVAACGGGVQEKGQEGKQKAAKMGSGGENAPSGAKRFFQNPRVWVSDDFHEAFLYLGCSLICLNHLS